MKKFIISLVIVAFGSVLCCYTEQPGDVERLISTNDGYSCGPFDVSDDGTQIVFLDYKSADVPYS